MPIQSKLPQVGTTIFSVMSRKATEHGAINLSQGFPDFDAPQRLQELLTEAMQQGHNQYPPSHGIAPLREAIADKVADLYGCMVDPEHEVTVTSGATEALFNAIAAVVHPGDEVIMFDPAYDSYDPAVTLAGGHSIHLPLTQPGFTVDWQQLRQKITPRTRLIILNSPHNPSGAVFSAQDLDCLSEIVADNDVLLLSDEVYEHIAFDPEGHQSLLSRPALAERAFVVSSFGKTYHCTGWKLGYCVAPAALTAEFRKVHQYVTFTSMTPAQHALARFMREVPEHHLELPDFYRAKRDRFQRHLKAAGFAFQPTPGTYFQVADYRQHADVDDVEFVEMLLRAGIAAIPISVFYEHKPVDQRLVRFCFAKTDETLDQAGELLCRL